MPKNDLSANMERALRDNVWWCDDCWLDFKSEKDQIKHIIKQHYAESMGKKKSIIDERSGIKNDGVTRDERYGIIDESSIKKAQQLPQNLFKKIGRKLRKIQTEKKVINPGSIIPKNPEREYALGFLGGICVWPNCKCIDYRILWIDHIDNRGYLDRKGPALHKKVLEMHYNRISITDIFQILCASHNILKARINQEREKIGRPPLEKINENTTWYQGELI